MGKRQEAALITKKNIVDAMRILLKEKSADTISIEDITTKAGVAKGSFYTHFKRKEDVISVIALEQYDLIKENVLKSKDGVYKQLISYLKGSAAIIEDNTLQIAQNWMKSVTAPLPEEVNGVEKYKNDSDNIKLILEKAVEVQELAFDTPVGYVGEWIMNVYYGAVASWCITKGEVDLVDNIGHFCDVALLPVLEKFMN